MVKKSRGLGKGLQALIPKIEEVEKKETEAPKDGIINIPVGKIIPNKKQPRKEFKDDKIKELADSINEHGFVQPIVVRKVGDHYELIAGERRWRASQSLQLENIPAIVKEVEDDKMGELALIENIQREDLNPIDEALAYKKLLNEFKITQDELSKRLGKSRSFIANLVRLLNLPPMIQKMVSDNELSTGHARALLAIDDRTLQVILAEKVAKNQLSVRQTEELVKSMLDENEEKEKDNPALTPVNPVIYQSEERLKNLLGTKVKIKHTGNKGKIEIEYYNEEDFNRIMELVLPGQDF